MNKCGYCHGARLVGWSGAGPILCPECSRDQDAFTVITQAWREQRAMVNELTAVVNAARRLTQVAEACDRESERHPSSQSSAPMVRYINAMSRLRDALASLPDGGEP